ALRARLMIPELAPVVDRPWRIGRVVAWDAAGKRELAEQLAQAGLVPRDVGVPLGVRAPHVGVRDARGPAMTGTHDVDRVEVALLDHAVGMGVDEVDAGCRAPVAQEAPLDVLELERT